MSNLSKQRTIVNLSLGIILAVVTLILTGLWEKLFDHDKADIIKTDSPKTDKIGIDSTPTVNKPFLTESIEEGKKPIKYDSITYTNEKTEVANVTNRSEKADFAVLASTNEKKDNQLAFVFVNWLKKYGTASNSILLNAFIEQGFFNQIMDGNSSAVLKANASKSAKYICLVRSSIDYTNSSAVEGLKVANCSYDVMIVETFSGRIIDTFNHTENPAEISEKRARLRAEDYLSNYLANRKLTL